MFETGMTTRADVLAVEVYRASAVQERIRAVNDLEVARAALNDAIGIGLDERRDTVTALIGGRSRQATRSKDYVSDRDWQNAPTRSRLRSASTCRQNRLARRARCSGPTVVVHGAVEAEPRIAWVDPGRRELAGGGR